MKSVLALILLSSGLAMADDSLFCKISYNYEVVWKGVVGVPANEAVYFGNLDGYSFRIENKSPGQFNLEVINNYESLRGYADGSLRQKGDEIKWTIWTRDLLLETSCVLDGTASR